LNPGQYPQERFDFTTSINDHHYEPMKVLALLLLLVLCRHAHSMDAGATYTYRFETLDLIFDGQPTNNFAWISIRLIHGDSPEPFVLRYELFEGPPSGTPILSNVFVSTPTRFNYTDGISNAWQDLDGSVRFTMVSGSARFHIPTFRVQRDGDIYISPLLRLPLTISRRSDAVDIRWLTNGSKYYSLQMRERLNDAEWIGVTNSPVVVGGEKVVTLPLSNAPTGFFRLSQ
jgi:hypothetical protein